MQDDTYPGRDIPEPLQPPQPAAAHEKKRDGAGWPQKIVLVLVGVIAGAALVAGGYALAGNRSTTNLTPLQHQIAALQQKVMVSQGELSAAGTQISTLTGQVFTLNVQYDLLKTNGITTYNETCPEGGIWFPCAAKEPPGFGPAGG